MEDNEDASNRAKANEYRSQKQAQDVTIDLGHDGCRQNGMNAINYIAILDNARKINELMVLRLQHLSQDG